MSARPFIHGILLLSFSFSFSACQTFGKKKKLDSGTWSSDSDSVSGTNVDAAGTGLGTPLPSRQDGASFLGGNVDRTRFQPIYFGFDSFAVSGSEQPKISEVAKALKKGETVIIAGFTDERGTPEYNRGLGERRAQAVRQSLLSQGVGNDRIQTVSFGAELPAAQGSGEAAWAKNRRAEFGIPK
jgi:peptidoglycan-associated lipoprotein